MNIKIKPINNIKIKSPSFKSAPYTEMRPEAYKAYMEQHNQIKTPSMYETLKEKVFGKEPKQHISYYA